MVARIASGSVATTLAIRDSRTRRPPAGLLNETDSADEQAVPEALLASLPDPSSLPAPPSEFADGFTAALISGQLPPSPMTQREAALRSVSVWSPPASELRLTDRRV